MDYKDILKEYWGYDNFRGIQEDIITSIGTGHDTLGLMPTGGGKSITFQVPALAMPGTCIVITPLISLMKDQVDRLHKMNIPAYAIHSNLLRKETVKILDNCIYGKIKFLYVSPERLESQLFLTKIKHVNISFITVDEAHCISQWGHDFRPSYLRIKKLRKIFPEKAFLALTATATEAVVEDIRRNLAFRDSNTFCMSFRRKNISYVVRHTENRMSEILHILSAVEGACIIYVNSRQKTYDLYRELRSKGISATDYHAGMDIAVKTRHQKEWHEGKERVIVATNAFGMGIDKPDVRLVIHYDAPSSVEAYFQEAGRAGRDGNKAYAVLLATADTIRTLRTRVSISYPEKEFIASVYSHVAYFYEIGVGMGKDMTFYFPIEKFCKIYGYNVNQVEAALNILHNAGYIIFDSSEDTKTRIRFTVERDDLYRLTELPADEEMMINCLIRTYSGLFTVYSYIEEDVIAQAMNIDNEHVVMMLKDLQRRRILTYIPPRINPKLIFSENRVDEKDIMLRPEVYDKRRMVMEKQVESMIAYIQDNRQCRQTHLVKYFGEKGEEDCNICDVCIEKRKLRNADEDTEQECRNAILTLLADGSRHLITETYSLPYQNNIVKKTLSKMIEEEYVFSDSITLRKGGK